MIELRYIKAPLESGRGTPAATISNEGVEEYELVLQYRWNKSLVGINTGAWSEWQDVPLPDGDVQNSDPVA